MARKIINFDRTQKRNISIAVLSLAVLGIVVYATFGGDGNSESNSSNNTGNSSVSSIGNDINNVESNSPDVDSLIDDSSPISQSAQETENREAERARESGDTYIGNLFDSEGDQNESVIEIPDYTMPEDNEPEPVKETEPEVKQPTTPSIRPKNEKQYVGVNVESLRQGYSNTVDLKQVLGETSTSPQAGQLTMFIDYDDTNSVAQNNQNNQNNNSDSKMENTSSRDSMYEAYVPGRRDSDNYTNEFRVTLGSQYYTTTAFAINSDDGGPALAVIGEGPLKGAKLQGEYQLNELAKAVNISYDKMSYKGKTYDIDAVAYNLDTDRPVLADDVDNHYFERYGGLFLSAFVASYADTLENQTTVVGDSGNVTSINDPLEKESDRIKSALGGPASILAEELRDNLDRPVTVYVDSGKGAGVLFLEDIDIQE